MNYFTQLFLLALLLWSCSGTHSSEKGNEENPETTEIIYHVFQRSFYDSNDDGIGDLNGLKEKLDYLQDLGVTSILMVPLYESVYYHNYFSSDFEKIDSTLGTEKDLIHLIKAVHERGMKIYMDMETQYVTEDHLWYRDSYGNPSSRYSDYITFDDGAQLKPSTIVFDLEGLKGYNGVYRRITTVNMNSKKVWDYNLKLFGHWMDPDGDGDFSDGVDGFRLDHMMDDLDNKGRWTHLFQNFWTPLFEQLREKNPKIKFMAEQANWASFGFDYFSEGNVDWIFAFRIAFEIRSLNKEKLEKIADTTFSNTPSVKNQIVFIENHDMSRYASVVDGDPGKLRVGAALNLLLGGVPSIYYGQEIGMQSGSQLQLSEITDGKEIPEREAMEWYRSDQGKGMAYWYKDSGPWWDGSQIKPNDGISVEEQVNDPNSLLSFYKEMAKFRKGHPLFSEGSFSVIGNDSKNVFSFLRYKDGEGLLVLINLASEEEKTILSPGESGTLIPGERIMGQATIEKEDEGLQIAMAPYGIEVFKVNLSKK